MTIILEINMPRRHRILNDLHAVMMLDAIWAVLYTICSSDSLKLRCSVPIAVMVMMKLFLMVGIEGVKATRCLKDRKLAYHVIVMVISIRAIFEKICTVHILMVAFTLLLVEARLVVMVVLNLVFSWTAHILRLLLMLPGFLRLQTLLFFITSVLLDQSNVVHEGDRWCLVQLCLLLRLYLIQIATLAFFTVVQDTPIISSTLTTTPLLSDGQRLIIYVRRLMSTIYARRWIISSVFNVLKRRCSMLQFWHLHHYWVWTLFLLKRRGPVFQTTRGCQNWELSDPRRGSRELTLRG